MANTLEVKQEVKVEEGPVGTTPLVPPQQASGVAVKTEFNHSPAKMTVVSQFCCH